MRIVLALLMIALAFPAIASEEKKGIVSFTFDDASITQYTNAYRIMEVGDLQGTLYAVSGSIDEATHEGVSHSLNWDQAREMSASGWEIGSHTHTHPHLPGLDDYQLFAELAYSKKRIAEEVGISPITLAFPYGEFDPRVIAETEDHYDFYLRAWGGSEGLNSLPVQGVGYDIGRFEVTRDHTSSQICDMLAATALNEQWLILLFHHVVETDPEEYQLSSAMFSEIVECAAVLQQEGALDVRTVADVLTNEGE